MKSCRSARSEAPTLASEMIEFDLKSKQSVVKRGAKSYLINKISGLSLIGGCKKKTERKTRAGRVKPRKSFSSSNRSTWSAPPRSMDGSCTYYPSESESEFNSDYDESFSDSSSSEGSLKSMTQDEEEEIFNVLQKSISSFVEDDFVDTDNEISGAEDVERRDSEGTRRTKALIHTLEAENAALRASVVALRSDWEGIVHRMNSIQDGEASCEVSEKSPNIEAIRALRDQVLDSLDAKHARDIVEREKRETDLQSYKNCVEELLCENEKLYDNVISLSQERDEILQELAKLKKEAVTSLEESCNSGLLFTDEGIAKSHQEYIDDIAKLLHRVKKDTVPRDKGGNHVDTMGNEIMKLMGKIITQRVEIESSRSVYSGSDAKAEDTQDAPPQETSFDSSALVVHRDSSRRSSRRSSSGSVISRSDHQDSGDTNGATRRGSSAYGGSSRRRSSRSECSESSRHSNLPRRRSSNYSEPSRTREASYSESPRHSSAYSESSRRSSEGGASSRRSDDFSEYSSDYTSCSESEYDDEFEEESSYLVIKETPFNSMTDDDGGVTSAVSSRCSTDSPDLEIIYEMFDGSDSESSSEGKHSSPQNSAKKNSWYKAVSSIAKRIRKNDSRCARRYMAEDEDAATRETRSSRRSSDCDNTYFSDVEFTFYPDMSNHSPSAASKSTSRSSSSRSSSKSGRQRSFVSNTSSNFSSIKEDEEMDFEEEMDVSGRDIAGSKSPVSSDFSNCTPKTMHEEDSAETETKVHDDEPQYRFNTPLSSEDLEQDERGTPASQASYATIDQGTPASKASYAIRKSSNLSDDPVVTTRRGISTGSSASYATSGSESTKERKGITITVVSRSSRFLTLPSSRSHTYMTFFTASLLKDQVDKVLHEQYHESMREIIESSTTILASGSSKTKMKKKHKYLGDFNEEGERHGYGIYKSKNGNEYRGEWQHNKREGLGVVRIGNGDVFEGQFDDNKKNGIGVYHYTDGECDLTRYKDDQRVGNSLRYTNDRKRAFLLTEGGQSEAITLDKAALEAMAMGVIIQI